MAKRNRKRERERALEAQRQRTDANRLKQVRAMGIAQYQSTSHQPLLSAQQRLNTYPPLFPLGTVERTQALLNKMPAAPTAPPPVFSQCVVGYRAWNIDPLGRLRPRTCDVAPWIPGINTAKCERGHYYPWGQGYQLHDAPAEDCDCGLYARFATSDLPTIEYNLDASWVTVIGSVAAWGDLRIHPNGMRAEKMCVTALALTDGMPAEIRVLVEQVATKYHVSAVAHDLLQAEAEMHGMPLPNDTRPAVGEPSTTPFGVFGQSLYVSRLANRAARVAIYNSTT